MLSIICGCFLFWQNAMADGGVGDLLVTPPALIEITDNLENYKQPYIKGSVLNEVKKVRIIIDKILIDEFEISQNDFSYQSKWNLKLGPHFVYAIGFDELGRASRISNVINFNIKPIDPHEPQISAIKIKAEQEKIDVEKAEQNILGNKIKNTDININKTFLLFLAIVMVLVGWFWYTKK